jgi:hypothetical protein
MAFQTDDQNKAGNSYHDAPFGVWRVDNDAIIIDFKRKLIWISGGASSHSASVLELQVKYFKIDKCTYLHRTGVREPFSTNKQCTPKKRIRFGQRRTGGRQQRSRQGLRRLPCLHTGTKQNIPRIAKMVEPLIPTIMYVMESGLKSESE